MAYIFNRGTKAEPKLAARYKKADGKWTMAAVPDEVMAGATTPRAMERRAQRWADDHQSKIDEAVRSGRPDPTRAALCGGLMDRWLGTLKNRNADDDRSRVKRHVRPAFVDRRVSDVRTADVLRWISSMRDGTAATAKSCARKGGAKLAPTLSEGSMRANVNLLSRFFGWAVEEEHVEINPVRQVPTGRRPHPPVRADQEWIDDDKLVRDIFHALPTPVNLAFYLGNRSGLRLGELCGLRMSDLGFLQDGVIRVRFSYDGPLKEDKRSEGKSKMVPAPIDAAEMLAEWLDARRHDGAGAEDLVFPPPARFKKNGDPWPRCMSPDARKQFIEREWDDVRETLGITLSFYAATRHSFVSRSMSRGASLDEVSAAVGHSSPVVTRRFYDHFVRSTFSATLREGLGLASVATARVLPMPAR